jgi:hypothetical protein
VRLAVARLTERPASRCGERYLFLKKLPVKLPDTRAPVAVVTLRHRTLSPLALLFLDALRGIVAERRRRSTGRGNCRQPLANLVSARLWLDLKRPTRTSAGRRYRERRSLYVRYAPNSRGKADIAIGPSPAISGELFQARGPLIRSPRRRV